MVGDARGREGWRGYDEMGRDEKEGEGMEGMVKDARWKNRQKERKNVGGKNSCEAQERIM